MVCLGNMCMDTVHKGDNDDDDDDDDDDGGGGGGGGDGDDDDDDDTQSALSSISSIWFAYCCSLTSLH